MVAAKILIVEDNQNLLATLKYNLFKESYDVITAVDGSQTIETAQSERPELMVLDVMLPNLSGFEVCRILRKEMTVPILMLTTKTEEVDKIVGLEIGTDDYMTKPFSMRELLARVRAMLRRADMVKLQPAGKQESLKAGGLEIDIGRHQAFCRGSPLDLIPKEYDLLIFLARNKGLSLVENSSWIKCGAMTIVAIHEL